MMREVNLLVFNGLGNRMRAIYSAIAFCDGSDYVLNLYWQIGNGLSCDFDLLFERSAVLHSITQWQTLSRIALARINFRLGCKKLSGMRVYRQDDIEACMAQDYDFKLLLDGTDMLIETHSRFFESSQPFRHFVPVKSLQTTIQQHTEGFDSHVVGVHVRRTDNRKATAVSTLDKFVAAMRTAIDADERARFFVASDDIDAIRALSKQFGERVMTYAKNSVDRNNPDAVRDALIEMYMLSKTRRLLVSYWSSFEYVAAKIGRIRVSVVQ